MLDEYLVVAEVQIREGFAVITRSDAELDPSTFELTGCYGDAGRLGHQTSGTCPDG